MVSIGSGHGFRCLKGRCCAHIVTCAGVGLHFPVVHCHEFLEGAGQAAFLTLQIHMAASIGGFRPCSLPHFSLVSCPAQPGLDPSPAVCRDRQASLEGSWWLQLLETARDLALLY